MSASGAPLPRWLRTAFALPRGLYRHRLGWLLGSRFLLLTHTGRNSGRRYDTVLEVVHHDRSGGEYVVVAGLGRRSDWYRNIRAGGPSQITVGRRTIPARARELSVEEAIEVLAAYERRNRLLMPVFRRALTRLSGVRYRRGPEGRRALVEKLPLIVFGPTA